MSNILNIVRKELDKVFRNPRLIFSTFILPGLMILINPVTFWFATEDLEEVDKE